MKRTLLTFGFLFPIFLSFAQNPKQLLQQSTSECQKIKNGYYELKRSMKFMDEKDTNSFNFFKAHFRKLENDSIYPIAFNSTQYYNGQHLRTIVYTGEDYVILSKDSSGQIMAKAKWAKLMMSRRHGDLFHFFAPFTGALYSPFPEAADYSNEKNIFNLAGQEKLNGFDCYHVQVTMYPAYDSTEVVYAVESIYDYWINKEDMLPVKYAASTKVVNNGDTLQEYFAWSLMQYKVNYLQEDTLKPWQLSSIPAYYNLVDYTETEKLELLKRDAVAPNWTLVSLEKENVSLSDYKGQLVLIDFFYKNCYPCIQALPTLKELNEKYSNKGLKVVGVNPLDKEGDGLKTYLSKLRVTYPIFLDTENVAKDYNVSNFPTIYLIDKNGKVLFASVGFQEELKNRLEQIIRQNL